MPRIPDILIGENERALYFTKENCADYVSAGKLYRKKTQTRAVRISGPFTVRTEHGMATCRDGYLAIDAHGWPYPIAKDEFEKIYEEVEE